MFTQGGSSFFVDQGKGYIVEAKVFRALMLFLLTEIA